MLAGPAASAPGPGPQPSQTKVTAAASPTTTPASGTRVGLRLGDPVGSGRATPGVGLACQERELQGKSHPAPSGASPWTGKGSSA